MLSPIAEVCAKCYRNTEKGVAKNTDIAGEGVGKSFLEKVPSSYVLYCHEQRRWGLRPLQTEATTKIKAQSKKEYSSEILA